MKTYVGTKIIQAEPMSHQEFMSEQGRKYDILDENKPGYKIVYPDGYVSWSPKEVFETAYREITVGELKLLTLVGDSLPAEKIDAVMERGGLA